MDTDFQKSFFSSLIKTLLKNGFSRVSSVKYWFSGTDIQRMFEIQKSRYSDLYYFNVYYLIFGSDIDPKTIPRGVSGHRLESLFSEHKYIIRGISFDTNNNEQEYADFLLLLDSQFLPRIKALAQSIDLLKDMNNI